jgi:acyl carrier protein
MSDTFEQARKIIALATRTAEADIKPETLLKDIKADSLHWVQVIVKVEETYDIEIDFEKMKTLGSIQDFVDYIDSLKK